MKAIIPVAGAGTRLRPHTYTQPKALIPVAGKPIMSFIIDQLKSVGIKDFVFVVGYLGDKIRDYVTEAHPNINSEFVVQEERKGLGHAIWLTQSVINKEEDIMIVLGDTIVDTDFSNFVDSKQSVLGIKKVDNPGSFGVAELNEFDQIIGLMEKPKIPVSNWALVGVYALKNTQRMYQILDELMEKRADEEQEIHLADALNIMIGDGEKMLGEKVEHWYDLGKSEILLETNATLLKKLGDMAPGIGKFEKSVIIPPVSIAEGVEIKNSIIGPNVTIGENTSIEFSMIKDSIIGSYSSLNEIILNQSIIGSDASVTGLSQSLNIGDNTEIDFSAK